MEASWQCHNNHVRTCPAGRTSLSINVDETYVQFYQGVYKGNVAVRTADLPADTPPLQQHATRSELRQGLTHVGVICDSAILQPLLPQILIAPKNVLRVGDLAACRASMPEPIYVVHKKSKWVNTAILVWLMRMIHWSLRHVRSQLHIIIMLDVLAVHFGEDLLRCMDSLSFKYMFIPAKLTWLIQPCDTHCFALYKRYLKLVILRYKARHHHDTVPTVLVWFTFIADTIVNMMNQRPWASAFRDNGFGDFQMGTSDYVKRHLSGTVMLPISTQTPSPEILARLFPVHRTNLPLPYFAAPIGPFAISGGAGGAGQHGGLFQMVNGYTNVRPAMPIRLDVILPRPPRAKAKAKPKAKA